MKNILVSGASGIVGYGILRSLRQSGNNYKLIGTTIYDDSVAQGFCDVFEKAPPTNDPIYFEWLTAIIQKHNVQLIIPSIEVDLYAWADNISIIEASGAKVLMNNLHLVSLCRDKWLFYKDIKQHNLPYSIDTSINTDYNWLVSNYGSPFLLKPRRGFASNGIVIVKTLETFNEHKKSIGPILIAQPIVGDQNEEFTVAAFGDGEGGYYNFMSMRRKLSKEGFTEKAEVVDIDGIEKALSVLCKLYKPIGPTNFQFRSHNSVLKLLEINPRISSSTSIRMAFGYNESAMSTEYYLENKIPGQPIVRRGRAVRYTEDYIFYEDSIHI